MSTEPHYTLETPENIEVDFELAGPGSRFCAVLIDWLIMWLIWLLVFSIAFLIVVRDFSFWQQWASQLGQGNLIGSWLTWVIALVILIGFAIPFGYYLFFELLMRGQTPGKKALRIRAIRDDGTPMAPMDVVVRNLVRLLDILPTGYGLGGLVSFFHPMHKRLGDLAAGTIVIKERELDYQAYRGKKYSVTPGAWVIANRELTKEERRPLVSFLQRRIALLPEARRHLAERLARPLFEKYGGEYRDAESYIERLVEGRHHEP